MLHRFLTFRCLISFFLVSLQASCCWDIQCVQSSIWSPVRKNRKLSPSFPEDWFSTVIHTPSQALHHIKNVFTSGTVLWFAAFSEILLSPTYPSFTSVYSFYRLSCCLFMRSCLYIHYSYMKGTSIWRWRFRVQSSLDNNCCCQLVSDLHELSVPSLSESLFRSALHKNKRFCSTILGNP